MILGSAMLASACTLGLAGYLFDRRYKKRLEAELEERVEAYRRRFQAVLDEEIERLGDLIEERVRKGVLDAVASLPSSEVVRETTQSVARTGLDLMEAGLGTLLGAKPRKR